MSGVAVGGAMMVGSMASWACCAAQCAGSLCCSLASCFGCSERAPTLAKLVYLFIFLSSAILAVVLRFVGQSAFQTSWYIPQINVCDNSIASCFGVQAVYRVSFALACFFAFMALLTAAAPVTHLGCWLIKLAMYVLFLGITLLITNDNMVRYAEAARVFSVLFLLSQVIIIVNLVYSVHEALIARMMAQEERLAREDRHSGLLGNCWSNLYVLLCVGFIVAGLTGCGLMYQYFGANCPLNQFFISQTLLVGLTLCALSLVFPGTFGRGLLPPALILAYNTYLTFSAITNNPDQVCNPTAASANQSQASIIAGLVLAIISVTWTALSSAGSIYSAVSTTAQAAEGVEVRENPAGKSTRSADTYQGRPKGAGAEAAEDEEEGEAGERRSRGGAAAAGSSAAAAAAPPAESRWKPFSFHLELFLAGCYVAMMASNWGDPSQQNSPGARNTPELSLASMWARMGSQFAIHILFIWTLVAPAVRCPCPLGCCRLL